jgi:hypothetical protein
MIPNGVIGKELFAGTVMALIVYTSRLLLGDSIPAVVVLIGLGAIAYFIVLLAISQEFRTTVKGNIPISISILSTDS